MDGGTVLKTMLYDESQATKRLTVASVAMQCDREPAANRAKVAGTVEAIAEAHPDVGLVVFGEMILGWYNPGGMPAYCRRIAEPVPGETTRMLGSLANARGVYLSLGMCEADGERLYSAQVLLDPQGEIQAVHRICSLKPGERDAGYSPGTASMTVTDINGVRTGIVICSDAANAHNVGPGQ